MKSEELRIQAEECMKRHGADGFCESYGCHTVLGLLDILAVSEERAEKAERQRDLFMAELKHDESNYKLERDKAEAERDDLRRKLEEARREARRVIEAMAVAINEMLDWECEHHQPVWTDSVHHNRFCDVAGAALVAGKTWVDAALAAARQILSGEDSNGQ